MQRITMESWLVSSDGLSEAYMLLVVRTCHVMESVRGSMNNRSIVSLVQMEECVLSCKLFPSMAMLDVS